MVRVMTSARAIAPLRSSPPLDERDLERASRLAIRLASDLGAVVRSLPEHARGGSGMARHLDLVRPTCQRIAQAIAQVDPGPETLIALPGVQGLEQFLDAAAETADRRACANARAAVAEFARFLVAIGGSQSRLAARLEASAGPAQEGSPRAEGDRRALFEASSRIMGRTVDTSLSIHIYRPLEGDEETLERWLVAGIIGARLSPGGMPLVVTAGKDEGRDATEAAVAAGRWNPSSPELLRDFTSNPLPTMTSRGSAGRQVQVIDPSDVHPGTPLDLVFAERMTSPITEASGAPALEEVWSLVNSPSRHLLFDVYLDERLERQFRLSVDAQLWYPNLASPGDDRWLTRLPGRPRIELLGRGIGQSATPAFERLEELTAHAFDRAGLDADRFVGFRCEVAYPVWRAGYRMAFEHIPE